MGPFRLKEYVPGQKLVMERNRYYWKADRNHQRLPYLDELVFLFVPSEDAQVLRYEGGETDLLQRLSADNYSALQKDAASRNFHLFDLGPSLDYNFLVFNLNATVPKDATDIARHQEWFRNVNFRQAVSTAVDRAAIVRLVFHRRGPALWWSTKPANKLSPDASLSQTPPSLVPPKPLLGHAGLSC